jgi:signal transduction histidine kinase
MKVQTKIAFIFTLLVGSLLLIMSLLVYYFADRLSSRDFLKRVYLRSWVAAKSHLDKEYPEQNIYSEFRKRHLEILPEQKEYFIKLAPDRSYIKIDSLRLPSSFYVEILSNKISYFRRKNDFYSGILYESREGPYIVIASATNDYIAAQLQNLRTILFIMFLCSALITFMIGRLFSRSIFQSVRRITDKVKDISAHNLHLRLDTGRGEDEIAELSSTFNNMLDRLETSFETQNNFVSNASHELSTPLTVIIGEAELSINRQRSQEETDKSFSVILSEAERLQGIIRSLLNLAQTGFNGIKQTWELIRLDELIWSVKETLDNIDPDNQVQIDYSLLPEDEESLKISGNEQLLKLALSNIILNGCKYSNNAPVVVALAATNENLIIIVKDTGVGIPAREIPYIYDPFFRASNTVNFKGYGIGLPLARNIIRMHKGDLQVISRENVGTEVRISLRIYKN